MIEMVYTAEVEWFVSNGYPCCDTCKQDKEPGTTICLTRWRRENGRTWEEYECSPCAIYTSPRKPYPNLDVASLLCPICSEKVVECFWCDSCMLGWDPDGTPKGDTT